MTWHIACRLDELADREPAAVVVESVPLCLIRLGDEVVALYDECAHEAVPLTEGEVVGDAIECWRHGSRFDLRSGEPLSPPAAVRVTTYSARVTGDVVHVQLGAG